MLGNRSRFAVNAEEGVQTIAFDGIAYGMVLFVLAIGFGMTLGLMNFINLAHGAFALAGGALTVLLAGRFNVSFFWCLPIAFAVCAALGALLQGSLYRRLYDRGPLDQMLLSLGLLFIAVAAVDWLIGSDPQSVTLPASLTGEVRVLGGTVTLYRLFIIILCSALAALLQIIFMQTRFGLQARAVADDRRGARGLGIATGRLYAATFAAGSGLAGLGGTLLTGLGGLSASFPFTYTIYALIVVVVGGTRTILGPFIAAIALGLVDLIGRSEFPGIGGYFIYAVMLAALIVRRQELLARYAHR